MNKEKILRLLGIMRNACAQADSAASYAEAKACWVIYDEADGMLSDAIVALYEENERLLNEVACLREEADELDGFISEIQERME